MRMDIKKPFIVIGMAVGLLILYFQNCSDVSLERRQQSSAPGVLEAGFFQGIFCHPDDISPLVSLYELSDLYVVNLNVLPLAGQLVTDSNMNGIPDHVDSDPESPLAETVLISGQDSDGDGLPDFLEILKGLNPSLPDAYQDGIDGDGVVNSREIQLGTDPHREDGYTYINFIVESFETQEACGQGQPAYRFSATRFPLLETISFVDHVNEDPFNLSHSANENVVLVIARMNPTHRDNRVVFLMAPFRLDVGQPTTVDLSPQDFHLLRATN